MGYETARTALIIGGFTNGENDGTAPRGLSFYDWNEGSPELVQSLDIVSPTWFVWDAVRRVLFVSQSATTQLTAVSMPEGPGSAVILDTIDIGCVNPAHISLSPDRTQVIAACFTGGEVVVVDLAADGTFAGVRARFQLEGRVAEATFRDSLQSEAEPHQSVFFNDGHSIVVPDRAQDALHHFARTSEGDVTYVGATSLRPGAGPRHLAINPAHPAVAYVADELDNTLVTLELVADRWVPVLSQPTLPAGFFGDAAVAAMSVSADSARAFVSNRGDESIAVFSLADPLRPALEGFIPVGGATPRFAGWIPGIDRLAIAAQNSHIVTIVGDVDGALAGQTETVVLAHHAPACLLAVGYAN